MIYSYFTGRVAKKAKVIDGVNRQFLSMDFAVNDYSKGEEVTQWVRVQSSDPAHLKLAEYFTKGRILRSEERRVGKECRSRWSPYH